MTFLDYIFWFKRLFMLGFLD